MSLAGIALIIIALTLCLLMSLLISTVVTIKRAMASFEVLTDTVHNDIQPSIHDLSELLVELKSINGEVAKYSEDAMGFMSELENTSTNLSRLYQIVRDVTSTSK
jgi:uncharacterized protein YoxC